MNATRVLLAEDHPILAEAVKHILEADCDVIATVGDGFALVKAARAFNPDVIVSDVSLPLLNGLVALRQIKDAGLRAKVIFLTMHADASLAKVAFEAGASGYVLKQSAVKELILAVREVASGNCYVTPLITDDAAAFLMNDPNGVGSAQPSPALPNHNPRSVEGGETAVHLIWLVAHLISLVGSLADRF